MSDKDWLNIHSLIRKYSDSALPVFIIGRKIAEDVGPSDSRSFWFNPESKFLYICWSPSDGYFDRSAIKEALSRSLSSFICGISEEVDSLPEEKDGPWMMVKTAGTEIYRYLNPIAQALGWVPGKFGTLMLGIPPSPFAAALSTGLLLSSLGYVWGRLRNFFDPMRFSPEHGDRMSKTGLIVGALSSVPWALSNLFNKKSIFSSWPYSDEYLRQSMTKESGYDNDKIQDILDEELPDAVKRNAMSAFNPSIDAKKFIKISWSTKLPLDIKAAAASIVDATQISVGGQRMVSPVDVARVVAGAGLDLGSGLLFGKTASAITKLSNDTVTKLLRNGKLDELIVFSLPLESVKNRV